MKMQVLITFDIETTNSSPEFMESLIEQVENDIHYDVAGYHFGNGKHSGGAYSIKSLDVLGE